jgi:hypothetical protein
MKSHVPNRIPASQRFLDVLYALVIIGLGGLGLFKGELLLPGRRTSGPNGMVLHGVSAWVMYGAMFCAVCVLLSSVVDHYDRRNNEASYRRFVQAGKICGWALFVSALVLHVLGL